MRERFSKPALMRALLEKGWPLDYVRRTTDELAEHWEDLRDGALERGLSEEEARDEATARIGSIDEVVGRLEAVHSNGTFAGRHPILCFAIAPLVSTLLGFCAFAFVAWLVSGPASWNQSLNGGVSPDWNFWQQALTWQHRISAVALPALFCWLAVRGFCGMKWATVACLFLSLQHGAQFARIGPNPGGGGGTFNFGYEFHSSFMAWNHAGYALPLLVLCAMLYVSHKRTQQIPA